MANYLPNMGMSALSGAASGAAAGSVIPGIGTLIGGIIGGIGGAVSGGLSTYGNESQSSQMQKMIDENYDKIMESINKEYTAGKSGIGAVYSSGAKSNKANTEATLGAEGLSGSPIAAALEREYGNTQAKNAAANYTNLQQNKANAELNATLNKGNSSQDLGLANMQSQNQLMNNNLNALSSVGGVLGTVLTPTNNNSQVDDNISPYVLPGYEENAPNTSNLTPAQQKKLLSTGTTDKEFLNNMGLGIK